MPVRTCVTDFVVNVVNVKCVLVMPKSYAITGMRD
jgi:hypothetical protein